MHFTKSFLLWNIMQKSVLGLEIPEETSIVRFKDEYEEDGYNKCSNDYHENVNDK